MPASRRHARRRSPLVSLLILCFVLVGVAIAAAADSVSERDAYRRFASDVRATLSCLESGEGTDVGAAPNHAHRCALYAFSLADAVSNSAIQHNRDRVLHLSSVVKVALDAEPANPTRAIEALRELEQLARPE